MKSRFSIDRINKGEDYAIVATNGYLNQTGGEKLLDECNKLIDAGFKKLIVNFEQTPIINSIGMSILFEIVEKLRELEGALYFCNLRSAIARTFSIMGITQYSTIVPDEEAAVAALTNTGLGL